MGLYDIPNDDVDGFDLPHFEYGFAAAPTKSTGTSPSQISQPRLRSDTDSSTQSSSSDDSQASGIGQTSHTDANASTTSTSTQSTSSSSPKDGDAIPAMTRPRRKSSRLIPRPARRPRQKSFDLYGSDHELQAAESRIGFCDQCFKQCEIH